jgi:hypothetical protein
VFQFPQLFLCAPPSRQTEFPLPQIPGFAAKDIRMVPFVTPATLLAILCAAELETGVIQASSAPIAAIAFTRSNLIC